MRLHRQTVRTFGRLAERIGLSPSAYEPLPAEMLSIGYDRVAALGLEMRTFEDALEIMNRLRAD